jgi:hypothetical protein
MNIKTWRYLVGGIYISYGLIKLTFGTCALSIPYDTLKNIPVLSLLAKEDHTISATMYEKVFILFGIYTILFGLTMYYLTPAPVSKVLEYKFTELFYMMTLGGFLTIFYLLVIYTDLPIPKEEESMGTYKLMGLGGGLSFIILPIIWESIIHFVPIFHQMTYYMKSCVLLVSVIIITLLVGVSIMVISKYKQKIKDYKNKLSSDLQRVIK